MRTLEAAAPCNPIRRRNSLRKIQSQPGGGQVYTNLATFLGDVLSLASGVHKVLVFVTELQNGSMRKRVEKGILS